MGTRSARIRGPATALLTALLFSACDDGGEGPMVPVQEYRLPIQVLKLAGDSAMGVVSQPVDPYVVRVVDADGSSLSGVIIDWVAEEGAGSVDHVRDITRVLPEIDGPASSATHWLGPEEGLHRVTAVASELPGVPRVTFEARAVSGMVLVESWYYDYGGAASREAAGMVPYYGDYDPDVAFVPDLVGIRVGETVGWRWQCLVWYGDCPDHDVVFEDDPTEPVSSPRQTDGWHVRTFDQAGEYRYRSTAWSEGFASGMVGTVRVR